MEIINSLKFCGKIHFSELFPTKWSGIIFVAYMALFVNQGLLVTASQDSSNGYLYNTIEAVLATEVIKLVVSIILYAKDHKIVNLVPDARVHSKVMYLYFVPAFLYCLYNNLAFVNLSTFDPTSYYLLLQLRVVITGILFQILFSRKLSGKQWASLVLLTTGCMIKELPWSYDVASTTTQAVTDNADVVIRAVDKGTAPLFSFHMFLIIVQVVCSCLAGVYNEVLLKSSDSETCNIYIQNIFMYIDSIVCNIALLAWQGQLPVLWDSQAFYSLFNFKVFLVILNNAAIGIVTSFFLRSLNSILKTFASALELLFTAVLTWLFFGTDMMDLQTNSDESEENFSESGLSEDQSDTNEDIIMDTGTNEDNSEHDGSYGNKLKENLAWADAMSKILKTNKPKRRKTIVLSRAKRANQVKILKEEKIDFDIESDVKPDISTEVSTTVSVKEENEVKRLKKKEWAVKGYIKPSVLEKDREKALAKVATRGVVQLFNAVREHQKTLEKDLEDAGPLEHKKDKVIKSLDKRAFLDVLMGPAKSQPVSKLIPKEIKEDADNPTWSILRDNFMMSSKLKDWDKLDSSEVKDET